MIRRGESPKILDPALAVQKAPNGQGLAWGDDQVGAGTEFPVILLRQPG